MLSTLHRKLALPHGELALPHGGLALLGVVLVGATAHAQNTWHVDVSAQPPGNGSASSPYTSLQFAIEHATTLSGDTLLVAPGLYAEGVNFRGKDLVVRSSGGASVTTLDGHSSTTCVRFENGESRAAVLEGFRLFNGTAFQGGGVRCIGASPSIRDCVVERCVAFTKGGGIFIAAGHPSFEGVLVIDNGAPAGGGIYADNAPGLVLARCTVGSSRVDLQACKLEYSIVSPK